MSGPPLFGPPAAGSDDERRALLRLTLVSGVGPRTARALLDKYGTATRVFDASEESLRATEGVGPKLARAVARAPRDVDLEAEIALCLRHGVTTVVGLDAVFPSPLREIPDAPSLLYVRGRLEQRDALAIGLVGSRRCTPYGLRIAERLATSLSRAGVTIVSGLARGIDAAAHRGALRAGGRTVAVLANGLAEVYPPEHEGLAAEVAAAGAVISESPMLQAPLAGLFPQRNRIIAGLCVGVIVVEATPRSGSLSTARHALEQGREVFAVPGPVDSLVSRGCHRLIRDGARLVETAEDVLEELGGRVRDFVTATAVPAASGPTKGDDVQHAARGVDALGEVERAVWTRLDDSPRAVDELIATTGLTPAQVLATLSMLEVRRLVRRLPGHCFVRA
ncbi:MAG: DNA-processing protein DprA [Planctomycetota bacterium]|nr:DNA-processing protein DprA [Planctomycetota bacterium]